MAEPQPPYPYGVPYPQQPYPGLPDATQPAPIPVSGALVPVPVTAPYPVPELVITQIGEIQVTSTTVRTPAGQFPLHGSRWYISDQWTTEQKIPTWAVVMAIVGFFCLTVFSLFFLLAKETIYRGVVVVQVTNGPYQYASRIPVPSQVFVQHIYQQVNYVRSLSVM